MTATPFKVVVVGLGYFSRFHIDAWTALPGAELVGLCDRDETRLADVAAGTGLSTSGDLGDLVARTAPDIVDIVAPPPAHGTLIRAALAPGRTIICQKPFSTSIDEANALIDAAEAAGTCLIVHENFRFQPWHREAREFLQGARMGAVYQARFELRPGDGRGADAYLSRQPAFRTMPRLLIHETGGHFIDLFRWFFGDITSVYAETRRLNPAIAGEDTALVSLHHSSGVRSILDGNRLSDHVSDQPRRTMGEMCIEGEGGALILSGDGRLSFRAFGTQEPEELPTTHPRDDTSFGGGCVAALNAHVIEALARDHPPENLARDYIHVMQATEAAYQAAETGARVYLRGV